MKLVNLSKLMMLALGIIVFLGACGDDDQGTFDPISVSLVGISSRTAVVGNETTIVFSVTSPAGYASNEVTVSPENAGVLNVSSIGMESTGGAVSVSFTPSIVGEAVITFTASDNASNTADATVTIVSSQQEVPVTITPVGTGFLESPLSLLGTPVFDNFTIPSFYDDATDGVFAPIAFNGQRRRRIQLGIIIDETDERSQIPAGRIRSIITDPATALAGINDFAANNGSTIESKVDEIRLDQGDRTQINLLLALGDMLEDVSASFAATASNGTEGFLTYDGGQGHFTANGLELNVALANTIIGGVLYDQMLDDYLRPTQSGPLQSGGNNQSGNSSFDDEGTERQHAFDESFGYFGVNSSDYPNANAVDGDGEYLAEFAFQFGDEIEAAFGVNPAERIMNAYIIGRSTLKAGEGFGPTNETTMEEFYFGARQDVILYGQVALASAIFFHLDEAASIAMGDANRVHHLSEALSLLYALSFTDPDNPRQDNPQQRLIENNSVLNIVLGELGWQSGARLEGIYGINVWEITNDQISSAENDLDNYFPGFAEITFAEN